MKGKRSKRDLVAAYFRAWPDQPLSALALEQYGGRLAWRTEVSRCRTELGMDIRWEPVRNDQGEVERSYYRFVPADQQGQAA